MIRKFIDDLRDGIDESLLEYDAGHVCELLDGFVIGYNQMGAESMFSIGQPVYDEYGELMGYLGIGLCNNLDYSTEKHVRVPCEYWQICLPTKHCKAGKKVFTYWQNEAKKSDIIED